MSDINRDERVECVVGFVFVENFILLLKKKEFDMWCLPGTVLEGGASVKQTLFEKLNQDIGVTATERVSFIKRYYAVHEDKNILYSIMAFLVEYEFPIQIDLSEDYSDVCFVTLKECLSLDLAKPLTRPLLEKFIDEFADPIALEDEEPEGFEGGE